ncbi:Thiosulfate sulfurtransferase, rhodanese [Serinicoccus hydrothermalis]|uniref:Thiosulfate sulfurtransferase, rhodanese n=1 Tax=Serinicoccus hydrothermalis TaxID=1758689 RepID=A0A1B1N7S7_9MICO|nr:sulfurtransferase [Serinicoccus hydrothermalis]ANS77486.1 Thiosulfate sulfurtransferase, rhodanese [Serinicoccus hydrothermalis]
MSGPLLTTAQLQAMLVGPAEERPVVVDVRWALGSEVEANRAAYLEEHLPGAVFLDLESVLSEEPADDGQGGRHPMPSAGTAQEGLRAAGVRADRPIVFYDAGPGLSAARAWWVAAYYGLEQAAVLDGGLAAWTAAGLSVEDGSVTPGPGDVELHPGGRQLLDADGVQEHLARGGQLLDARPAERYRGENETIDPVAGHIPGALSLPALSLVDDEGFVDAEHVVGALTEAGGRTDPPTAVYCGSGVQAAHLALALEARGVGPRPAVYVGSWSDWISDPARPVEP